MLRSLVSTRENQTLDLWAAGWKGQAIADELGYSGRGSVNLIIKKFRERGDARAHARPQKDLRKPRRTIAEVRERLQQWEEAKPKPLPIVRGTTKPLPAMHLLAADLWKPIPGTKPVTIMQLKPHQCRWVVGINYEFCGEPKNSEVDTSYCPAHHRASVIRRCSAA